MAGLNFEELSGGSAADSELHPRNIFAALPDKSSKYEYLRDVQREVIDKWFKNRPQRDTVVKMNTGNGKTAVGILMLKSCLNEGYGPAVYLTPTNYLADQAEETALDLGLSVSRDPRDYSVTSGDAILITTIYTLFNGRSKFGVAEQGRKIKIGSVLIDDAHACLGITEQQFQIRVPSHSPAYGKLIGVLRSELKQQYPTSLLSVEDGDPQPALMVPPWAWQDKKEAIIELLHSCRHDEGLEWGWPLIHELIHSCHCFITADEILVKPPFPPVANIPSFTEASRRIYLTATLADDSILVTHFGADAQSVRSAITPSAADDIGDRMILVPQEVCPEWTDESIRDYLSELAQTRNVVVIVPSKPRARYWGSVAAETLDTHNLREGVERLKSGHVGLVVMVNKYDGVDLPDDACRILVIDGLPESYSGAERIESAALEDSPATMSRQLQRIEQGMGRGIRSRDDYCVVLLLGSKLVQRMHDPESLSQFSTATRRQLELSRRASAQLKKGTLEDLKKAVEQCLDRTSGWARTSRNALVGVQYGDSRVSESSRYAREAFDLASVRRFSEAVEVQQKAINAVAAPRERGWLKQQQAAFLHPVSEVRAQALQTKALDDNRALLRPAAGVAYVRLASKVQQQGAVACEFLSSRYPTAEDLLIGVNAVIGDLEYDPEPGRADSFEQAVADLGSHLGFATQRPERDFKRGPDDLWSLGQKSYFVIECKSGAITDFIRKKDASQLSGSMDWFHGEYEETDKATPVMFHRVNVFESSAAAPQNVRVVTERNLEEVKEDFRALVAAIAYGDDYKNPEAMARHLVAHRFNGAGALHGRSKVAAA